MLFVNIHIEIINTLRLGFFFININLKVEQNLVLQTNNYWFYKENWKSKFKSPF